MIGKTISHYKILEKLGEGGMGVVYRAEDTKLKRTVALKFLSPQSLGSKKEKSRFIHEAQAAAALDHSNICTVYEINEADGKSFITMAYVGGPSLREEVESGPLDVDRAVDIAIQVAEGLRVAHGKGIIHRDIKSANIMLTSEGQAKITDFGLAKLPGRTKLTKTGSTVGTLAYMSPEQLQGMEVDHRTDIWSLGVVLYELLTGKVPFKGDHEAAIIYSIVYHDVEPPSNLTPDVPTELDSIVAKMLQKNPHDRYAGAEELLSDLRKVQAGAAVRVALPMSRKAKRVMWGLSAVVVVAVVLLVGIKIQIGRQPDASAAENKLAVMYFENMADPEDTDRLGDIVTNLLITDLSESRYMQVVSSQRLHDISKLLGQEDAKVVDKDLASQIAEKANARWMLLGSILQIEPQVTLTGQLVDVSSGNAIASQKIRGELGKDLFSLIDELTIEIKKDLSLPRAAMSEMDRPIAEVTTDSPEAYRYYVEGLDNLNKAYFPDARKSFEKALQSDSTLAMAYYHLTDLWEDKATEMITNALKHSHKVSKKEQLLIKARHALYTQSADRAINQLQEIVERYPDEKEAHFELAWLCENYGCPTERILHHYTKAIEIDPRYMDAYNQLAYNYNALGDYDKAIWAIDKCISIAPGEAFPYDTKGDIYAYNGKIDRAIESYKKALQIKPDLWFSLANLGNMYLFKRDYEKAESNYLALCSNTEKTIRSRGRRCLALIPTYQGRLGAALEVLDAGIAADKIEHTGKTYHRSKYLMKSFLHVEKGDWELAREQAEIYVEAYKKDNPDVVPHGRHEYIDILARSGMIKEAERVAEELKKDLEEKDPDWMDIHWIATGHIEMAKGNPKVAAQYYQRAVNDYPENWFYWLFFLGEAYLHAGELGEAVDVLETALTRYDDTRAVSGVMAVKIHYLLGMAYEKSGWNKKAIEQYGTFLDIWKDADPGIPEVEDAKERLAKLKRGE